MMPTPGRVGLRATARAVLWMVSCALATGAVAQEVVTLPEPRIPMGAGTRSVVSLDADLDGIADMVAAARSEDRVLLRLGRGDGSFGEPGEILRTGAPWMLLAGDLNRDGAMDLVVLGARSSESGSITVLHALGDGSFSVRGDLTLGSRLVDGRLADLDADGALDLVVVDVPVLFGDEGGLHLLAGRGDGLLVLHASLPYSGAPRTVAVGDINGDGHLDLLNSSISPLLTTWLGDGSLAFSPGPTMWLGVPGWGTLDVADLDGDGNLDLVGGDSMGVITALGQGDGTFQNAGFNSAGGLVERVVVTELVGSSALDVLAVTKGWFGPGHLVVLEGVGNGRLDPVASVAVGVNPKDVTLADLQSDGIVDLLVANSTSGDVSVLRGLPAEGWAGTSPKYLTVGMEGLTVLAAGDVDRDGHVDVFTGWMSAGGSGPARIRVLLGDGHGSLGAAIEQTILEEGAMRALALLHADADGKLDLALIETNQVLLLRGAGDGTFGAPDALPVGLQPSGLAAADLDGDGALDLVTSNEGSNDLSILLGRGDGSFAPAAFIPLGGAPMQLALGDVDGDGVLDLAVGGVGPTGVQVLLGRGDGTFGPAVGVDPGTNPWALALADLDGDGDADLVTRDIQAHTVGVALSVGAGVFASPRVYAGAAGKGALLVVDLTGDGVADVVTNSSAPVSSSLRVFPGLGDGTLAGPVVFGAEPNSLFATADMDEDGLNDLIVAARLPPSVTVLTHAAPSPWSNLGHGLPAGHRVPALCGMGLARPDTQVGLRLSATEPFSMGWLVLGFAQAWLPFGGGVLVPSLDLTLPILTDARGEATFTQRWPAGIPSGFELVAQAWIVGEAGWSASNGQRLLSP